jgi:peptidyl-prolyl cis-trans isomerase A (cyclophilin A)
MADSHSPVVRRVVAKRLFLAVLLAGSWMQAHRAMAQTAESTVRIHIETTFGDIVVDVDTVRAPVTATNFLRYVDAGLYDGGSFFRTVHADNQPTDSIRIAVIQGGADRSRSDAFYDAIPLERTNVTELGHVDGAISMARSGPDTATHSFFICIGDQPELDFGGRRNPDGQGFAAFGRVVSGMDVVRSIQMQPAEAQNLAPPVVIESIARE